MMHKVWCGIEEMPYCFPRSSIKFQGHTAWDIANFDPNCAFLDCNSSLNSPMDLKCTKLDVVRKKCPIVFLSHPSNFTVTWAEKTSIWIQFEIARPVAAIKSLRFALLLKKHPIHVRIQEIPPLGPIYVDFSHIYIYCAYGAEEWGCAPFFRQMLHNKALDLRASRSSLKFVFSSSFALVRSRQPARQVPRHDCFEICQTWVYTSHHTRQGACWGETEK